MAKTAYTIRIGPGHWRAQCTKCPWHFTAAHWHTAALEAAKHRH